jgi:GNAT superfamily N-acetyltransferase
MTVTMPLAIHLRQATGGDHAALQALYVACLRRADWLPPHARDGDLAHDAYGLSQWLASDAQGRLLGFVAFDPTDQVVHHLYVAPAVRRRGVARKLLGAVLEQAARGPWRLRCLRANAVALACYARLGWLPRGCGLDDDGRYLMLQSPCAA